MSQRWISTAEFCATYGYAHKETVYALRKKGYIHGVKRFGKWYFLDPGLFEGTDARIRELDKIPILRGEEVAKILHVIPRRVRTLAEQGRLPYRLIGNNRRYSVNDLRQLLGYRLAREARAYTSPRRPIVTSEHVERAVIRWALERLADL